jgi:hypothetical protein
MHMCMTPVLFTTPDTLAHPLLAALLLLAASAAAVHFVRMLAHMCPRSTPACVLACTFGAALMCALVPMLRLTLGEAQALAVLPAAFLAVIAHAVCVWCTGIKISVYYKAKPFCD